MSYNTISDFRLFAVPSGSFNNVPDTVVQRYLDEGSSLLNSALRVHHTLPLATGSYTASSDLASIYNAEITIASYKIMIWRGLKPNVDGTNDQVLIQQYNEIMTPDGGLLDHITKGKIVFPQESDATPNVSEQRIKLYGNPGRITRYVDDNGQELI